jgi:ubiquitin C
MHIFVRTTHEMIIVLEVEAVDTTINLKVMIHVVFGIPPDHQRLFFAEQELEDSRTLSDYNIQTGKILV